MKKKHNPLEASLTIYYEDFAYKVKTDCALAMIAGFLELDDIDLNKRPPYHAGRSYKAYFNSNEVSAVERLVKIMLAHILERYFN